MSGIETGIALDVVAWFQSWGKPVLWVILFPFHYIGSEYGYLVLLPIAYWSISKEHGKRLMILSLTVALVGQYLKFTFRRPRPYMVAPLRIPALVEESGFGLPSGHTLFGTAVGGYAWYKSKVFWVRFAGVAFAILMGVSRMVHGVHYPQDVLAGWVIGVLVVVVFWWVDTRWLDRMRAWTVSREAVAIAAASVVTFVLALVVEHDFEERKAMLSIVGALAGGLTGFSIERRLIAFSSHGSVSQRVIRGVVGLVTTLAIYLGLDVLYDVVVGDASGIGALIVYVARYGLVAFWIAAGAPFLYTRTRLAGVD